MKLEFYTEVLDLSYLIEFLNDSSISPKFIGLNKAICSLIEDYSLVGFHPLAIQDAKTVIRLAKVIDKVNGYMYGEIPGKDLLNRIDLPTDDWEILNSMNIADVQEKVIADEEQTQEEPSESVHR